MLLLQRGRAQLSAECYQLMLGQCHDRFASTGPRSIERGMHDLAFRLDGVPAVASTGPRSIERGMSQDRKLLGQRKRCFNGAALN